MLCLQSYQMQLFDIFWPINIAMQSTCSPPFSSQTHQQLSLVSHLFHKLIQQHQDTPQDILDCPSDCSISLNDIKQIHKMYQQFTQQLGVQIEEWRGSQPRAFKVMTWLPPQICARAQPKQRVRMVLKAEREKHRGPYRSYTIQQKNRVVDMHAFGLTFAYISKELKIPQKNVVRWCKEGELNKEFTRRVSDPEMEKELEKWCRKMLTQGKRMALPEIQHKALELSRHAEFRASRGWCKKFCKRMQIARK